MRLLLVCRQKKQKLQHLIKLPDSFLRLPKREAQGKIKVAVDSVSGEQASLVRLSDIDDEEMVSQGSLSSTGYGRSYKVAFGMLNKDGTLDMVDRNDLSKIKLPEELTLIW